MNSNSRKRLLRWGGLALIAGFLFLNAIAFQQSRELIRFAAADKAPRRHGWKAALLGVELPRPVNKTDPSAIGLPFTTRTFQGAKGEKIEAWVLPTDTAPLGTVITFHGHAGSKESLMSVSATLHRWGWKVWMVDFYGSGGSSGQETSIGWFEADDVRAAFEEVQKDSSGQRVVLYGSSMGAAAVMRSVAVHELSPHGVILECPFDRLRTTVASRFKREGAPTFPMLDLILFWGGVQSGFNPYEHNPVNYAKRIRCPSLLMQGDRDLTISVEESLSIAGALGKECHLRMFTSLGHEPLQAGNPKLWEEEVFEFLSHL